MTIKALIAEGSLEYALAVAEAAVRSNPLDYRHRTALFALLCFNGELSRAEQQLTVLSQENREAEKGTALYRALLSASRTRERVLRGEQPGVCLLNEPSYVAAQRQVIRHSASGDLAAACQARQEVAAQLPTVLGECAGLTGSVRDADDRIGPFAELFLHDQYMWLPWEQIRALKVSPPVHLRDLLWAPVTVELDAGPVQAFMPVLYPASSSSADPRVRLGRITTWQDNELGLALGVGAKLLTVQPSGSDSFEDIALLQVDTWQRLDAVTAVGAAQQAAVV